jgi:outer membrane protein assembly factor BamB
MSDITSHVPPTLREAVTHEPSAAPALPAAASAPRRLRLWPGVLIVILQWLSLTLPGWIAPGSKYDFYSKFLTPVWPAALVVWWLFFSRARWADRLLVPAFGALAGGAAALLRDQSVPLWALTLYGLPAVCTASVGWLLVTPRLRWPLRRAGLLAAFALAWSFFTVVRFDGMYGTFSADWSPRWVANDEEQFRAQMDRDRPLAAAAEGQSLQPGDWPGFRGPARDGCLRGVRIATDWNQRPPRELWRRRVGPGWSSFAVIGNRLYTQEQHGNDEAVVCYHTDTGKPIWVHRDRARFDEQMAGPGPRATPTFHEGRIYAQGAAGRLNCLDAATGRVLWSRDVLADSGRDKPPEWGYAASPLVVGGIVVVYGGGPTGKSVLGYRASSGKPAWSAGEGQYSYCSPQPARLGGAEQVLMTTDVGLTAYRPANGEVLWQHSWPLDKMPRVVQPALVGESDVLIGTGFDEGTRRLRPQQTAHGWAAEEVWATRAIRPYFNDMVLHQGHLYGFDSGFLTCVRLDDGEGRWRARGYDSGQVLLLADQGLLLVVAEKKGDVALVEANPDRHRELGRFHAVKGKTWNHPVVAHGKLFVRNGAEMACFELAQDLEKQ